jgi:hypothetical protein
MRLIKQLIYISAAILVLYACKTAQVSGVDYQYEEDLSKFRLATLETVEMSSTPKESKLPAARLTGDITQEIDSITRLMTSRNAARKNWDGYTIQIYTGNSRQEAETIKSEFDALYPEIATSLIYFQPTYKVKAGSFFDRLEATRKYEEVKVFFPRALLIPEKLSLPVYASDN